MKQKLQPKPKQAESQSEQSEEFTIAKLHAQKTLPKIGLSYLVEFKGMADKEQWVWKPEHELANMTGFKKELKKYLKQQVKTKDADGGNSNIVQEKDEKKPAAKTPAKTATIGEYKVNKQVLKQKMKQVFSQKSNQQQQSSLQAFLKPQTTPQPIQQPQQPRQQPTLPSKPPTEPPKPTNTAKTQPSSSQWIEKIKLIKLIKGYEIKNGQPLYEVDVWDKNGQAFFVPPLSSETVKKIDVTKLANFLQGNLTQGWREQQTAKMERE